MHVPLITCMIQVYFMRSTGVFHACTMHGTNIFHECTMHGTCTCIFPVCNMHTCRQNILFDYTYYTQEYIIIIIKFEWLTQTSCETQQCSSWLVPRWVVLDQLLANTHLTYKVVVQYTTVYRDIRI